MSKSKSKTFLSWFFILGGLGSLYFVPWMLLKAMLLPMPSTVQEQLDDALDMGAPGVIVYSKINGQDSHTYASGFSNVQNQLPAVGNELFKIASVNKLYIAAAMVKLSSSGAVDLNGSLNDYLPSIARRLEHGNEITLASMISHKSGIPNFTEHPDFPWDNPPATTMDVLEYAFVQSSEFRPGEDSVYSNTNYVLLTMVMDSVLGYDYFDFIQQELLSPLGLTHTYKSMHTASSQTMMSGYFVGWEPEITNNYFGSMVATAEDVGLFIEALHQNAFFTEEEAITYRRLYVLDHTGLLPGYQTIARYDKELDGVVVLFMNINGGLMWSLAEINHRRIIKILKRQYLP